MMAVSQQLVSCLQEVDLRLDTLKVRMEQLEHLEDISMQVHMSAFRRLNAGFKAAAC